ncbi:unnamed protein product [Orchesella dallaii]|uniref:Uncharacterized protein n=1 Tax=Orchesella dallaii TaxID=48710 RepID=A0ABP1RMT5_9HEXA
MENVMPGNMIKAVEFGGAYYYPKEDVDIKFKASMTVLANIIKRQLAENDDMHDKMSTQKLANSKLWNELFLCKGKLNKPQVSEIERRNLKFLELEKENWREQKVQMEVQINSFQQKMREFELSAVPKKDQGNHALPLKKKPETSKLKSKLQNPAKPVTKGTGNQKKTVEYEKLKIGEKKVVKKGNGEDSKKRGNWDRSGRDLRSFGPEEEVSFDPIPSTSAATALESMRKKNGITKKPIIRLRFLTLSNEMMRGRKQKSSIVHKRNKSNGQKPEVRNKDSLKGSIYKDSKDVPMRKRRANAASGSWPRFIRRSARLEKKLTKKLAAAERMESKNEVVST